MTETQVTIDNVYTEPRDRDDKEKKQNTKKVFTGERHERRDRDRERGEYKEKQPESEEEDDGLDSDGFEIVGAEKKKSENREYKPRNNYNRNWEKKDKNYKDNRGFNKNTKKETSPCKQNVAEEKTLEANAENELKKKNDKTTVKVDTTVKKLKDLFC
jgi:hypothetical protein